MADTIGIKIGIDGEKEFKSAIAAINAQMKTFSSEMYASVDSMTKVSDKETLITNKTDILKKQIETTKQKIEVLSGEYDRQVDYLSELDAALQKTTAEFGENSDEALKAQNAYNKQVTAVEKLQTQLNTAQGDLNSYSYEMDHVKESMENAGKEGSLLGNIIKGEIISEAIISGVKKLGSAFKEFLVDSIDVSAAVKAENSKFEQTFGEMGGTAKKVIKDISAETGIFETRLNNTASNIYAFARASGANTTEAMELTKTALKAAADSAAYYDTSLEEAGITLQSFLKGNYENDAALGVSATETTRNAKAMELFGKKFNDLSEIQKQQTLLKMVTDAQELSGAMGQANREMAGWENVKGNLQEVGRQLTASVGGPLLDIVIPATQQLTQWLQGISPEDVSAGIQTVINTVQAAIPIMAGLTAAFVAYKAAVGITALIDAFRKAQEAATLATQLSTFAQKLLNAELLANPIVLVTTLIAGFVAALATAYATSETFREKVNAAFGAVKKVVEGVVNFFIEGWNNVKNAWGQVSGFFADVKNKISEAFSNIINLALTWGKDLLQNFINGIKSKIQGLVDTVKNVGRKVKDFLGFSEPDKGPLSNFHTFAPDMMKLYAQGIKGNTWRVEDAAADAAGQIKKSLASSIKGGVTAMSYDVSANLKSPTDMVTKGSLYQATEAAVNGMSINASTAGSDSGDVISININMDGRTLASVLFDPLKREVMQRGEGLA